MPQFSASAPQDGTSRLALPFRFSGVLNPPVIVVLATIVGAFLRFYNVGTQSLSRDEALVYWLSQERLGHLLSRDLALTGIHPPLFYLLHFAWSRLLTALAIPASEVTLRIPGIIIGSLAVPVYFAGARRLFGARIA